MKIIADYHTHTNFSHGIGTIRENIEAAIARGLKQVAITDHGPAVLGLGIRKAETLLEMKEIVQRCNAEYSEIEVLIGVEANVISFDGQLDIPLPILKEMDLVLAGLHRLIMPASLADAWGYYFFNYVGNNISDKLADKARSFNTQALIAAVQNNNINIITHPGHHFSVDTVRLARACARRGTALEINAGHAYDLEDFVRVSAPTGVKFAIDSDAHTPDRVGDVASAIAIAEKLNLPAEQIINAEI